MSNKRLRDEYLVDQITGETLKGDELFANTDQLLYILRNSTYAEVARFETVSTRARVFIQKHNVWRLLFARDYGYIFQNAIEMPNYQMKKYIKDILDNYSEEGRVGLEYTYWKRYYEFLKKTSTEIRDHQIAHKRLYPMMDPNSICPPYWEYMAYKPIPLRSLRKYFLRSGRVTITRQPDTDVFYYSILLPENMSSVMINMADMSTTEVPITKDIESYPKIRFEKDGNIEFSVEQSTDGLSWYNFSWINNQIYKIVPRRSRQFLVSCSICSESVTQLYHCGCCAQVYCGEKCQSVNH